MRMKPRLGTVILLVSMVCGTASARTGVIDIADYKGRYDTQDMTPFVYTPVSYTHLVYVTAENLFTCTGYSGYDPEVSFWNRLIPGLDYTNYPRARSVFFGFSIKY